MRNDVEMVPHYLNVWTAAANRTAGAAAGGAGFGATGAEDRRHIQSCCLHTLWGLSRLCVGVSPAVELFLGCFGAVYWNDSFPWPAFWSSPNRDASLALQRRHVKRKDGEAPHHWNWNSKSSCSLLSVSTAASGSPSITQRRGAELWLSAGDAELGKAGSGLGPRLSNWQHVRGVSCLPAPPKQSLLKQAAAPVTQGSRTGRSHHMLITPNMWTRTTKAHWSLRYSGVIKEISDSWQIQSQQCSFSICYTVCCFYSPARCSLFVLWCRCVNDKCPEMLYINKTINHIKPHRHQ